MNLQKIRQATELLDSKLIDLQEWTARCLGEDYRGVWSEEYLRRCAVFVRNMLNGADDCESDEKDANILSQLREAKIELEKERKKLQTTGLQIQENYRNLARSELMIEQIGDAIRGLDQIVIKQFEHTNPQQRTALLVVADQHYDSNFKVDGLWGETVNLYNKDVFANRMWSLLAKMDADKFDYDVLKVVSCGDALEGLIRMSSLQKLRQPVVKSTIEFAEFMSQWLVEASNRLGIPVEFAIVPGNHSTLRILTQKPEFPEENLEYIIHKFIEIRLENEENVTVEPYNDVYFTTIYNENMVFTHGENKDISDVIRHLENMYDVTIDRCYAAHYHSSSTKDIGVGNVGAKQIIRVPSICGTDPYAVKCCKNNRAGAYFAVFDEDGECFNKIYYLS
jgi:hypothetical protein